MTGSGIGWAIKRGPLDYLSVSLLADHREFDGDRAACSSSRRLICRSLIDTCPGTDIQGDIWRRTHISNTKTLSPRHPSRITSTYLVLFCMLSHIVKLIKRTNCCDMCSCSGPTWRWHRHISAWEWMGGWDGSLSIWSISLAEAMNDNNDNDDWEGWTVTTANQEEEPI